MIQEKEYRIKESILNRIIEDSMEFGFNDGRNKKEFIRSLKIGLGFIDYEMG